MTQVRPIDRSEFAHSPSSTSRCGPVYNFNQETRTVLRKSEQGLEVTRFDSADTLFEDLGI